MESEIIEICENMELLENAKLAENPKIRRDGKYFNNKIFGYIKANEFEKALEVYEEALECNAAAPGVFANAEIASNVLCDFDKTIEIYNKAKSKSRTNANVFSECAFAYNNKRNYYMTINVYKYALHVNERISKDNGFLNSNLFNNAIVASNRMEKYNLSLKIYDKASLTNNLNEDICKEAINAAIKSKNYDFIKIIKADLTYLKNKNSKTAYVRGSEI